MSDGGEDLFADSDDEESPPPKKAATKSVPKAKAKSGDDSDDLFDSSDEDEEKEPKPKSKPSPKKAGLSKREKLEALAKKKRTDEGGSEKKPKSKKPKDPAASGAKKKDSGYDSGDSYESGTFERTQADDDFIDTTGEDEDRVAELYADQHFDDERPDDEEEEGGRRKKGGVGGGGGGGGRKRGAPEAEEVDEQGVPKNPMMAVVHKMKKKKREKKSTDEIDEEVRTFLGKMELAAEEDELAVAERRPAMSKLQFLGQVEDMLTKLDLQKSLLDAHVLAVCKRWLQPLPNGKLGNVTVRHRLLQAISQMNSGTDEGITPYHLKNSQLGRVVMVLFKHPDETPTIKRLCKQLIEQWSRPIFQKSGNMKDLEHAGRQATGLAAIKRRADAQQHMHERQENERRQVDGGKHANLKSLIATGRSSAEGASGSANRVRVPFSKGFAFTQRPDYEKLEPAKKGGPAPVKDNRGKLAKRMLEKGRAVQKNQRSANISVEGRATKG